MVFLCLSRDFPFDIPNFTIRHDHHDAGGGLVVPGHPGLWADDQRHALGVRSSAELSGAQRSSAAQRSSELSGAQRSSAELSGAQRSSAELSGAQRSSAELSGALGVRSSAELSGALGVSNRPVRCGKTYDRLIGDRWYFTGELCGFRRRSLSGFCWFIHVEKGWKRTFMKLWQIHENGATWSDSSGTSELMILVHEYLHVHRNCQFRSQALE